MGEINFVNFKSFLEDPTNTFTSIFYGSQPLKKILFNNNVLWDTPETSEESGNPYLTFSSPSSFTLSVGNTTKNWNGTIESSTDTQNWSVWDGTTSLTSVDTESTYYLYLRGTENHHIGHSGIVAHRFVIIGQNVSVAGNIENLLNYATVTSGQHPQMDTYCYANMFYSCTAITDASGLIIPSLSDRCCASMFYDCSSLSHAPQLPATTLSPYCYNLMFRGCSALQIPPLLPATSLSNSCYKAMFSNSGLIIAPALNAMTLASDCYDNMFYGCEYLTRPCELPATTLAEYCYTAMFSGCTMLNELPSLPAIDLPSSCYAQMFDGCIGIKLSETQIGEYQTPYRIPASGSGQAQSALSATTDMMFEGTSGTYTGESDGWIPYFPLNKTVYVCAPTILHFTLSSDLTQNIYFTQSQADGVIIDWGDGSATETVAATNAQTSHTYAAAGDYVVMMTATNGVTWSPGATIDSKTYGIIGEVVTKSSTYPTLTAVKLGDGCTLRQNSFYGCTSITNVVIPDGTTTIPNSAFGNCSRLVDVILPSSILSIECQGIPADGINFHITDLAAFCGIDWIDSGAGTGATSILALASSYLNRLFLNGIEVVGTITIPSGVQKIGDFALHGLNKITSIDIPNSVTTIGKYAFCGVGVVDCIIPSTVQTVGTSIFYTGTIATLQHLEIGCSEIESETLSGNVVSDAIIWVRNTVNVLGARQLCSGHASTIYCEDAASQPGWSSVFNQGDSSSVYHTVVYNQSTRPW